MGKILVVSDDDNFRQLVVKILEENHEVISSTYGAVIKKVQDENNLIEMVIMDFAFAIEAVKYMEITTIISFLEGINEDVQIIAMIDDNDEDQVARWIGTNRIIHKSGLSELVLL